MGTVRKAGKRSAKQPPLTIALAIQMLIESASRSKNLYMPGDGRYQPKPLRAIFGYDQFAKWLVLIEFFWLMTLAKAGIMPESTARLLTPALLKKLFNAITTTKQDERENDKFDKRKKLVQKGTRHDINALLELMRPLLPAPLRRWLHFSATSYDIICPAYALQMSAAWSHVIWPKLCTIDVMWRRHIKAHAASVQMGRTHLQHALPVTVGFWLASLHTRFRDCALDIKRSVANIHSKFSGMTGNSAAQKALCGRSLEDTMLELLGLKAAPVSTQIAPPEYMSRVYYGMLLLSGALSNLGDDIRKLQAQEYGELLTFGSTSSTGAHKRNNPIAAENACGMHVNIIAEFQKVILTLSSDFQRDLRWSSVMRSQPALVVYFYQQLLSVERLLGSIQINEDGLYRNFSMTGRQCMGELTHLSLQQAGYVGSHSLVNGPLLDRVNDLTGQTMADAIEWLIDEEGDAKLRRAWRKVPDHIKELLAQPEEYLGDAIDIAKREARLVLR